MKKINIKSPIIPMVSIGDIMLGEHIDDYILSFKKDIFIIDGNNYETQYGILNIPIYIYVTNDCGLIHKLSAFHGYEGKYKEYLSVGMSVSSILTEDTEFYYDDFYEGLLDKSKTILLEFSDNIPWDSVRIDEMIIEYITIFSADSYLF